MKILQTFNDLDYEITDEQADQIMEASTSSKQNGIWIKGDYVAFAAIKNISSLPEKPIVQQALPAGRGFKGIIEKAPNKGLELMAKGLKKFISERKAKGESTRNSEKLLETMRLIYARKNVDKQLA